MQAVQASPNIYLRSTLGIFWITAVVTASLKYASLSIAPQAIRGVLKISWRLNPLTWMLRAGLALICLCWGTWHYLTWQVTCWVSSGMRMFQRRSLARLLGQEWPFWHFRVYQLPKRKRCLRRRIENLRWCLRQSLTCKSRAAGNCHIGILLAFETVHDVWEQQKVSQDLRPRPQPWLTSTSTFPKLWVWAFPGQPTSMEQPFASQTLS